MAPSSIVASWSGNVSLSGQGRVGKLLRASLGCINAEFRDQLLWFFSVFEIQGLHILCIVPKWKISKIKCHSFFICQIFSISCDCLARFSVCLSDLDEKLSGFIEFKGVSSLSKFSKRNLQKNVWSFLKFGKVGTHMYVINSMHGQILIPSNPGPGSTQAPPSRCMDKLLESVDGQASSFDYSPNSMAHPTSAGLKIWSTCNGFPGKK